MTVDELMKALAKHDSMLSVRVFFVSPDNTGVEMEIENGVYLGTYDEPLPDGMGEAVIIDCGKLSR